MLKSVLIHKIVIFVADNNRCYEKPHRIPVCNTALFRDGWM